MELITSKQDYVSEFVKLDIFNVVWLFYSRIYIYDYIFQIFEKNYDKVSIKDAKELLKTLLTFV